MCVLNIFFSMENYLRFQYLPAGDISEGNSFPTYSSSGNESHIPLLIAFFCYFFYPKQHEANEIVTLPFSCRIDDKKTLDGIQNLLMF